MFKFEWDDQKAVSNLQKHGVSFDEAVSMFGDGLALTFADTDHAEMEDRSRTYGTSNKARLFGSDPYRAPQRHSDHQRTKGDSI